MRMIQNTFLKKQNNNSFFQSNKKGISSMIHIIEKLYLVFFNYEIILVEIFGSVEVYQADRQMSQSRMIF